MADAKAKADDKPKTEEPKGPQAGEPVKAEKQDGPQQITQRPDIQSGDSDSPTPEGSNTGEAGGAPQYATATRHQAERMGNEDTQRLLKAQQQAMGSGQTLMVTEHVVKSALAAQAALEASTNRLDHAEGGAVYLVNGVEVDHDGNPKKRKSKSSED